MTLPSPSASARPERTAQHATFVIERTFSAPPSRVFAAWAEPAAKARWFGGPAEWSHTPHELDFRVGGRERLTGGPPGGTQHRFDATYQDIVPDRRIVYTYDLHLDDRRISVSLTTVELHPEGAGTRLVFTEQGVYLDGYDDAGQREEGTRALLDNLAADVARATA